jgi:pyruvate/2-oxoglutarate dehydrogenase complex dihydrolipoamide acyltransferase (E2) component
MERMKVEMVMPQMGESIAEGTILKWIKKEGDVVEKDENILEISTDKVDSEIPAPAAGRIVALLAAEGETVPVGQVVAHIETDVASAGTAKPEGPKPAAATKDAPAPPVVPDAAKPVGTAGTLTPPVVPQPPARPAAIASPAAVAPKPSAGAGPPVHVPAKDETGRFYSPLVRSIAQAEGIALSELQAIPGTGLGGRLTKDDLLAYVEGRKGGPAMLPRPEILREAKPQAGPTVTSPGRLPAAPPAPPIEPIETRTTPDGVIDVVPMDHIRQRIAEHMVRSKATSPHVASIAEAEMTRIVRYREAAKAGFEREEGFKLTYTPFFVAAVVRALKEFPYVNASIEGTNILIKRFINVGMAVATDYGLIVPVLRGADTLSFLGIARGVNDLARRARSKDLKPDEVAGGTFSITNMGTVGTLFGIPIIAQPQVAILGIGAIQKRAVVRDDAIAIREMVYLCLSYDHRLVDGAMGGAFVERVARYLETQELP